MAGLSSQVGDVVITKSFAEISARWEEAPVVRVGGRSRPKSYIEAGVWARVAAHPAANTATIMRNFFISRFLKVWREMPGAVQSLLLPVLVEAATGQTVNFAAALPPAKARDRYCEYYA